MFYLQWVLLGVVSASEVNFIVNLVQTFETIYRYDSLAVFRGSTIDDGECDKFLATLSEGPMIPRLIGTASNGFNLQYAINSTSLVVIFAGDQSDEILTASLKSLKGRRTTIQAIFIIENPGDVQLFFQWAWRKQFTKPLLVNGTDVFSINPYPTPRVINVTSHKPDDMFPHDTLNFKGYEVRTPIKRDMPRVFWYKLNEGKRELSGYGGRLFANFMKYAHINLSLYEENSSKYLEMGAVLKLIGRGSIEISAHPYIIFNRSLFGGSYPLDMATYCLVQPLGQPLPHYVYIFLPFSRGVWIMVVVSFLYITITLSQLPLGEDRPFDLGAAALVSIAVMQNTPPPPAHTLHSFNSLRIVYVQLFLFGFILSNIYLALLASYLTTDVYKIQDDTIEAVIQRKQTILISEFEQRFILKHTEAPEAFSKLLLTADTDTFSRLRNSLNPKYSYIVPSDRWHFLSMQQLFMKRRISWISPNVCFSSFPLQFPMQYDSHLNRPLSKFIMATQESGLYKYWQKSAFRRALAMHYVHLFIDDVGGFEPLPLEFLYNVLLLWVCGLMVGTVVFLLEMNTTKLSRMINTLRRLFT